MLQIMIFSLWIAVLILMTIPVILTLTLGTYIAKKLRFIGLDYYCFMVLFYMIMLCILIII